MILWKDGLNVAKLILVRGLPGSGKSTYANNLLNEGGAFRVIEADAFFVDPVTGEYVFKPNLIADAHAWCRAQTLQHLTAGTNVIVSNTFVTRWELDPYLEFRFNHEVSIVEMRTRYQSIHGVPENTIQKMKYKWEDITTICQFANIPLTVISSK